MYPGHLLEIWDCLRDSRTVGAYVSLLSRLASKGFGEPLWNFHMRIRSWLWHMQPIATYCITVANHMYNHTDQSASFNCQSSMLPYRPITLHGLELIGVHCRMRTEDSAKVHVCHDVPWDYDTHACRSHNLAMLYHSTEL